MNKDNNLLNGNELKAITSGQKEFPRFLEHEETSKKSIKLYYCIWLSRFFIFFTTLSLLLFLAASISLFRLAPQVTVEPFLIINQNTSDDMVWAEPIAPDMTSKEEMMKTYVKQYIIYRNTYVCDEIEMMTRWFPGGLINFLSSEDVFQDFYKEKEKNWGKMLQEGKNREVEILSINKVGGAKSPVWKVDYKTYETSENSDSTGQSTLNLEIRYWTASVTSFFIPERIFTGRRLINHLGFTVVRYNQSEVSF